VVGASGDAGRRPTRPATSGDYPFPATSWPPSDPLVTGVGGTKLSLYAHGNRNRAGHGVGTTASTVPTNQLIFGDNGPNA